MYDETSGQLVKQKEEQRLLSRWFNWSGNTDSEANDEDKEQEQIWKLILEKAVKQKIEPTRIQALRI